MFESPLIRLLVLVVVVAMAFFAWKLLSKKEHMSEVSYSSPAVFKADVPMVPPIPRKTQLSPSPIDTSMVPYGEWDTNRHTPDFVTNVSKGFPTPADSDSIPDALAWKASQKIASAVQMPDIAFSYPTVHGMVEPSVGGESNFQGQFGTTMDEWAPIH